MNRTKIGSGSKERINLFTECAKKNNSARKTYEVNTVKYDNVKLSKQQKINIIEWIKQKWGKNVDKLLTYKGMKAIQDELLCRFLRPSEIIDICNMLRLYPVINYATVPIVPDVNVSELLGRLGEKNIKMTEKFNLLYIWYHSSTNKMVIYATDEDSKKAISNIKLAISNIKFIDNSKQIEWNSKEYVSKMDPYASTFNPAISTTRTSNPKTSTTRTSNSKKSTTRTSNPKTSTTKTSNPKTSTTKTSKLNHTARTFKPK